MFSLVINERLWTLQELVANGTKVGVVTQCSRRPSAMWMIVHPLLFNFPYSGDEK
jgi:hypothetical protein